MAYSLNYWTSAFPTKANVGQWFYVKHDDGVHPPSVRLCEVLLEGETLRLAPECNMGMQKPAFGNPLSFYSRELTQFCGPVPLPPGFHELRQRANSPAQ